MEKRSGKDRRRFKRLNDRRKQLTQNVGNADWFHWIVGIAVAAVLFGYWTVAVSF